MNHAPVDRFDALRDSIVAHLEQVQIHLHADIEAAAQGVERRLREEIRGVRLDLAGVEQRLTRRLDSVDARLDALRAEMVERFESVDQRFRALELRMTLFENKVTDRLDVITAEMELLKGKVAALDANLARLHTRLDPLEAALGSWAAGIAALGEDVKQRFRVVNERLTGIEQRLAA